jgi:hypothetical protein
LLNLPERNQNVIQIEPPWVNMGGYGEAPARQRRESSAGMSHGKALRLNLLAHRLSDSSRVWFQPFQLVGREGEARPDPELPPAGKFNQKPNLHKLFEVGR